MRAPIILVVDDEALLRMLAADYFNDGGFEVLEASNGAEALAILRANPSIRAVFTDVQMPGTPDGLALSHHVRALNPQAAIVVVSGRVLPDPDDLAAGARFVTKPYVGQEVVELVQDMIGLGPH